MLRSLGVGNLISHTPERGSVLQAGDGDTYTAHKLWYVCVSANRDMIILAALLAYCIIPYRERPLLIARLYYSLLRASTSYPFILKFSGSLDKSSTPYKVEYIIEFFYVHLHGIVVSGIYFVQIL